MTKHAEPTPSLSKATAYSAIVLLILLGMVIVGETITPEDRGYARFHFALVTSSLLFVLLFLVRVNHKGIQHLPRRLLDRQEWKQYASSGALGPDALLLVGLFTLIWAVDWDAVREYRVQIGAVSAIVVVRLLVLIVKHRRMSRVAARQR